MRRKQEKSGLYDLLFILPSASTASVCFVILQRSFLKRVGRAIPSQIMEVKAMNTPATAAPRLSRFTGFSTLLSIIACYGTLALVTLLSFLGITIDIHTGVWAGVITLFAWLAVAGVASSFRRNRAVGPLLIAAVGAVFITWAMFVSFNRIIEIAGFSGLIFAAVWERYLRFPARQSSV